MNDQTLDTLTEAINISTVVALINHKYAVNYDNDAKAEVLTEILNELKLYLLPAVSPVKH